MTLSLLLFLQLWSGIIDAPRAIDWASVGVDGGIPTGQTQCGATVTAYSGTAGTINSAIDACSSGQFVQLDSGTFTLTTDVQMDQDGVTLRGMGASLTRIVYSGAFSDPSTGCHLGDNRVFEMCQGSGNIGVDSPDHTATWSAGYSQGTSTVTISDKTGLSVGSTIWLDQLDTSTDYPATGDVKYDTWGTAPYTRADRTLVEGHVVTSIEGGSCAPNCDIGITPPIMHAVFRSGQTPGAWWGDANHLLNNAGIEDLTVDLSASGENGLYVVNCTDCWIKGVRVINNAALSSQHRMVHFVNVVRGSFVDNYFYGPRASSVVSIYGTATSLISASIFQNNIIHGSVNPFVINGSNFGNVFAYNYFNNTSLSASFSQASFILHSHADFNLFEGNDGKLLSVDNIHTAHFFDTVFRNHWNSKAFNPGTGETQAGIALYAINRFFNVLGNVSGHSQWSSYENSQAPPAHCTTCIFELGWEGTSSSYDATGYGNDTRVKDTLFRWGNWDHVTSSDDNGTNDATGTKFDSGEVPNAITNYANTEPASETLPDSFYLSARPDPWWGTPYGTPAWPPIGPDVANGDINNGSTEPTGGHANKIPARLCYENTGADSNYSGSSPAIIEFDRETCYIAAEEEAAASSSRHRMRLR